MLQGEFYLLSDALSLLFSVYEWNNKLSIHVTVHREQSMKTEKTNKMRQSDAYYQLLSQHVPGIILPIFRRTKTVLLHMVYYSGSAGCGW